MIATDSERLERIVHLTRDLMLIPGTVDRPADRERALSFVRNHLEDAPGVRVTDYQCNGTPSLVALPEGVDEPEILLSCHLDVISHPDLSMYNSRIDDDRIVGPGAGDMKGQVAILMELFHYFHHANPGVSLGIMITTDEETGGHDGVRYLFEDVGFRAGMVINPDGGDLNRVTIGEKGMLHLQLRAYGESAHASRPWQGRNALEILVDRVGALRKRFPHPLEQKDHWHTTCSFTRSHTPNQTNNCVPDEAEMTVDIRFIPPHSLDEIVNEVGELLGPDVELRVRVGAEPLTLHPDPLYSEICERIVGSVEFCRDDGASDARFIAPFDIPVVISRPTVGQLHSVDEWIDIPSMGTFFTINAEYIRRKLCLDGMD